MKKCPFCAEEIKDEAIVCRYCGRDLPKPEILQFEQTHSSTETPLQTKVSEKELPSAWVQGRKASIVLTILYLLTLPFSSNGQSDLVGKLTIGLAATFFGWWLICSAIVWLWRKLGGGVFMLLVIAVIIAFIYASSAMELPTSITPAIVTPTRKPIPTATFFSFPTKPLGVSNCYWWYEIPISSRGDYICVQGIVDNITGSTEFDPRTRIYFTSIPSGFIRTNETTSLFYFIDDGYYYPNLKTGACVYASGQLRITDRGEYFMQAGGTLQNCD